MKELIVVAVALGALAVAGSALAVPTLTISDGAATATVMSPTGVVNYQNTNFDGGAWSVVIVSAETKPALGSPCNPAMDLNIQATSLGTPNRNLHISWSDSGFGPPPSNIVAKITGRVNLGTGQNVTYNTYYDAGNVTGATNTLLTASGVLAPPIYSSTNTSSGGAITQTLYSLTQVVTIGSGAGAGGSYTLDASLSATSAPVFTSVPTGGSLGCNPANAALPTDASVKAQVTGKGNCGLTATNVTHLDGGTACASNRTFTITINDAYGNTNSTNAVYTWTANTTPPVFTCAANKTVQCGTTWEFDPPTAVSACCTNLTITVLSTVTNGIACPQVITSTWQVADCCSNLATCSQTVTVMDNEPCSSTSRGTEFWLTFPGNYAPDPNHPPQPQLFITGTTGTVGTVSMPGLAVPFTANFTIPGGGAATVTLPAVADLGNANNLIQTNGIHVVASQSVSVYGYNHIPFTTDAFLGLSTRSIGKSYLVLSYRNVFTNVPELNGSQFAIVATVDNTTISIIPSNSVGWAPFSFTMMKGQTYQLLNTNSAPADITGTSVVADQPIAVFGSHQCANIPDANVIFADYLVEQLFPLELWGTNFVTVPLATRLKGDTFRFMAMLDDTTVSTNGVALPGILRGQFNEVQLATTAQITSTKPIQVAQYADSSDFDLVEKSDPFMVLIPPTSLFATNYVVQTPTVDFTNDNFINVMAPTASAVAGHIFRDGLAVSGFLPIGASGYSGAQVQVTIGPHTLYSSDGSAFGIIVYGWAEYDAYGYPGGICGSAQTETSQFTCPQTNPVVQAGCNGLAPIPDLTTQVGNLSSARLITQRPAAGTLVSSDTTNITLTMVDQFGASQICTTPLTVLPGPGSGAPVKLAITRSSSTVTISWPGCGVLQRAANVIGPWVTLSNVTSPYTVPISGSAAFFRVVQ